MNLRNIDENILEMTEAQGYDKSGLRKAVIVPDFPLTKMTTSDILVIPWGVRPNTWSPPLALDGMGPRVWIETPNGNVRLDWDGNRFVSETLILDVEGNNLLFSGESDFEIESCGSLCNDQFPEGYRFLKTTGPNALFEITKMDPQEDLHGRLSHYSLLIESLDQKNVILTE